MLEWFKFPYTNFQQVNLDWIMDKLKFLVNNQNEVSEAAATATEAANNASAAAIEATAAATNADSAAATATATAQNAVNTAQNAVNTAQNAVNTAQNAETIANGIADTAEGAADAAAVAQTTADDAINSIDFDAPQTIDLSNGSMINCEGTPSGIITVVLSKNKKYAKIYGRFGIANFARSTTSPGIEFATTIFQGISPTDGMNIVPAGIIIAEPSQLRVSAGIRVAPDYLRVFISENPGTSAGANRITGYLYPCLYQLQSFGDE